MADSYYDVLGVTPDASEEEIERAFRETVKTVHPDHNDEEDAGERFRRVREARDTLLDAKARQRYDRRRKRDRKRSHAGDNETASGGPSSHEWAREQRRQQRKQQQRQQAQQRRERRQRRTRENRQRQRRTQSTSRKKRESRERTRASRQAETQTRKRASNQKRQANGRNRTRPGGEWLRDISHRPRQWVRMHFHSSETIREWLGTVATLPTTIRLGAAVVLVFITTVTARAVDLSPVTSPTLGIVIVLGSLIASYAAYAVLTPLPFEKPRERSRFKPAGGTLIWLAVAMNVIGLGLFGFAAINGAKFAGIPFTISSGVYAGTLLLGFSILLTSMVAAIMDVLFEERISDAQAAKYGFMGASIATPLWMFTRHSGGGTLRDFIRHSVAGSPNTAPWIPPVVIGPLYLGSFANFVLAVVCIGCFFGSLIAMCWYLTVVPWRDHYERGYQVRPTIWNLVVAAPFVVLAWMALANVPAVTVGRITLRQSTLWFAVFVLPTPLIGAYLLRRRLEPKLRAYEWR